MSTQKNFPSPFSDANSQSSLFRCFVLAQQSTINTKISSSKYQGKVKLASVSASASCVGVGRYPSIPLHARPTVVPHRRPLGCLERVGHHLEALRRIQPYVGDDNVAGSRQNHQSKRVAETLRLELMVMVMVNVTDKAVCSFASRDREE